MKKTINVIISLFILMAISIPNAFSGSCDDTSPPSSTSPGGGHPDDSYAVDSGFINDNNTIFYSDPSAVNFLHGHFKELSTFYNAFKKSEVGTDAASSALDLLNSTPLLVIPSGGLYGYENSAFFKATLDEFVKQGGTLVVFAQQHGYEFSVLPVPQESDGSYRQISGYGWEEDQNCFADAVYIETWHQMLSGQNRSTPTLNVDGYFTNYPSASTVLLRRTANGQAAMLMYDYGQGKVIATSMYSDWAYAHGQASKEEAALVGDMISWAKLPADLPEVQAGTQVTVSVAVTNSTVTDAAAVKMQIYSPDRSALLSERTVSISVPAGQSVDIAESYTPITISPLGIYHVDYILLDAQGDIIPPGRNRFRPFCGERSAPDRNDRQADMVLRDDPNAAGFLR